MKIFGWLFLKKMKEEDPKDLMRISSKIAPLVNDTVNGVFASFGMELLEESIVYIVPAVWGASKEGELTDLQKEINTKVAPVINKIAEALTIKDQNPAQKFAVGYVVRSLFVARFTQMIEAFRNKIAAKADLATQNHIDLLQDVDPMGNA